MNSPREEHVGLRAWFDIVWKHKWLVIAFAGLVLTVTSVLTSRQTKIYEASTQLVIELAAPQYMSRTGNEVLSLGNGNSWNTKEFFETQYRIIKSRMVASMVVKRLGLDRDLDFLGVNKIEDPDQRARALESADPVSLVVSRVDVDPVADSRVVYINVRDRDPARAAKLADAVAAAYTDQNVDRKVSAAGEAVTWLRGQAELLQTELNRSEDKLLEYKKSNDILSASLADKQNLLGLNLQDAQRQLRESGSVSATLKGQLDQVQALSLEEATVSVEQVLSNGLIQRLKEQLVALQNERSDLLKRYLEKHPDVKVADEQIKRVRRAIAEEVTGVRKSIERQYLAALKAERKLAGEVSTLQNEARGMHGQELEYKRLDSSVESGKELLSQMQLRLKEAELQADSRANNVRVLDGALVPMAPVSPRLFMNLAVAAILALVGGIGLAFLVEQLDSSVKTQEQLENDYGLTFLGIIPKIRTARRGKQGITNPDRYVLDSPNCTAAECVRTIRTNLLFMAPERELRSMLVTSAGPSEGKTSTCVNIGATMAMSGSRILLIDSDLRRPRLHKIFDMTNERGLTNMIMDAKVVSKDMVHDSGVPGMDVMCSGPLPPNPAELLHTKGFRRTLDTLLSEYDRVIFDSPPVCAVTDAQILGMQVDGTVLVVRAGQTTRDMLHKAVRLLSDVNVNILGALLNNLDVSRRGYGQYYYQYYRQHGAYTQDDQPAKS